MCPLCVCVMPCDVLRVGACTGVSVFEFPILARTEFGVPLEHHTGNLCLFALSKKGFRHNSTQS